MISDRRLAALYLTLAQGERAGLPRARQLAACAGMGRRLDRAVSRAARAVRGGMTLAEAGRRAGLWPGADASDPRAWEHALIEAGEAGGTLAEVLQGLAQHYQLRCAYRQKLRAGLLLPVLLWLLWLAVSPLPALARGDWRVAGYGVWLLAGCFGPVLAVGLLWRLPGWLRTGGLGGVVDWLQLATPGIGPWYRRRRWAACLRSLALLLEAGLPAQRALALAGRFTNGTLRRQIDAALASLRAGATLAQALAGVDGLDAAAVAAVRGGEGSGKLAPALMHYCQREEAAISHQDRALFTWAPRLVYLLLVALMAWQMVGDA